MKKKKTPPTRVPTTGAPFQERRRGAKTFVRTHECVHPEELWPLCLSLRKRDAEPLSAGAGQIGSHGGLIEFNDPSAGSPRLVQMRGQVCGSKKPQLYHIPHALSAQLLSKQTTTASSHGTLFSAAGLYLKLP